MIVKTENQDNVGSNFDFNELTSVYVLVYNLHSFRLQLKLGKLKNNPQNQNYLNLSLTNDDPHQISTHIWKYQQNAINAPNPTWNKCLLI